MNQALYDFALWLDNTAWSTGLHESFYVYNWVETTHVLALALSLGLLIVIDLRMLGYTLETIPADDLAQRLRWPMALGFTVMIATGLVLFYAIPVRNTQSLWLRLKLLLLFAAAINAFVFHKRMRESGGSWAPSNKVPASLRVGAGVSLILWLLVIICGRLIAYDWFDCANQPSALVQTFVGCISGQEHF